MLRNTSYEQLDLFQHLEYHRIPKNNILLKIDSEISLDFTNDLLADKYNKAFGRPAYRPETMIRIGILQRMYDLSDKLSSGCIFIITEANTSMTHSSESF